MEIGVGENAKCEAKGPGKGSAWSAVVAGTQAGFPGGRAGPRPLLKASEIRKLHV